MGKFLDWLNEKEGKESEYQIFFRKKLEKYKVKSASELSKEDKMKFFSEIEKEWTGDENDVKKSKEENEEKEVNESKDDWDKIKDIVEKVSKLFKGHSKITSNNSLSIEVDGIVGKITFDPTFKI